LRASSLALWSCHSAMVKSNARSGMSVGSNGSSRDTMSKTVYMAAFIEIIPQRSIEDANTQTLILVALSIDKHAPRLTGSQCRPPLCTSAYRGCEGATSLARPHRNGRSRAGLESALHTPLQPRIGRPIKAREYRSTRPTEFG